MAFLLNLNLTLYYIKWMDKFSPVLLPQQSKCGGIFCFFKEKKFWALLFVGHPYWHEQS
jgi:hypothetical protein